MFANTVQPSLISLFSSTSSNPLQIFSKNVDPQLPEDSLICLVDDSTSKPSGDTLTVGTLIGVVERDKGSVEENDEDGLQDWQGEGYTLVQRVLQIQSPTLTKTFIQCPPITSSAQLSISSPHLHIQVRSLGREWSFEVGVTDRAGRIGIIRCSTFQVRGHEVFG